MLSLGNKKKIPTMKLTRLGVFATQFVEKETLSESSVTKQLPGRSMGSMEFRLNDMDPNEVF